MGIDMNHIFATSLNELEDFVLVMSVEDNEIFRYVYANKTALEKGNVSENDYGKRMEDVLLPRRVAYLKSIYKKAIVLKERIVIEEYAKLKNGSVLGEATVTPVLSPDGRCTHVVIVARNITEKKRNEEQLYNTNNMLDSFINSSGDGICILNPSMIVTRLNKAYTEMLGFQEDDLIGKSTNEYLDSPYAEEFERIFDYVMEGHELKDFQSQRKRKEGTIVHVAITFSPFRDSRGEIIGVICLFRDITERRRIEEELRTTVEKLEISMKERVKNEELIRSLDRLSVIGQLAAGVAHEIRNPLTALKGFSKILLSTLNSAEQKRYLHIMMDELERIDLIVNEFMSLAKPQAVEYKDESLFELIQSTITILETQASLHNVQIRYTNFDERLMIRCQPNQIKQVFMNFIKNAIEAMVDGGLIEINVERLEHQVAIIVKDQGMGIEKERLKYLGTPFYTTKEKGIGLGLTVSNKIIQEHGGTMTINSKLGHGTTVQVFLPYLDNDPVR